MPSRIGYRCAPSPEISHPSDISPLPFAPSSRRGCWVCGQRSIARRLGFIVAREFARRSISRGDAADSVLSAPELEEHEREDALSVTAAPILPAQQIAHRALIEQ